MPDVSIYCVVEQGIKLSAPTRKIQLNEPLAYDNALAHAMRIMAYNDDGTEADLTGYSVVGAFTPIGHNTIAPLLNGSVTGNVAQVLLPSACYKQPGRFKFTMNLTDTAGASRTVLWVEGIVERNQTDTIEAPTDVLNVTQVISQAQAAAQAANEAASDANEAASSIQTGTVSEFKTYLGIA